MSLIKKKNTLGFSVSFNFPANACFFPSSGGLYIAWGILCSEGVSWKEGTPLFGLDGNVALSRAWVSGSWTGILNKNVKVGYKQSTFVIPTMFDQKNQILRR